MPLRKTILLVDDHPLILNSLGHYFRLKGYGVLTAPDGMAALALARSHRIDAALVDVRMPGMDGFAVCRALVAAAPERLFPVWLMTTLFSPSLCRRAIEAGAVTLLEKPFNFATVIEAIEARTSTRETAAPAVASG